MSLKVEPAEDPMREGCACCEGGGGVRGFVYEGEEPCAVYFAESGGMANKPVVLIGLAIGRWGSDADVNERACVVFACSADEGSAQIRPTIPYLLSFPEFRTLGVGVEPEQAEAHVNYPRMREALDAIIAQDPRLAHLRADPAARRPRFSADAP
jgi:hypothetical protein